MGQVVELFQSRTQLSADNIAERSTATFEYLATGYPDEESALADVIAAAGPTYDAMNYHSAELTERLTTNPNSWKFKVKFIAPPATVFQYDSTGGTQHVTQSIATVGKYGDYSNLLGGAIGFDGENVAGVDKVVPVFTWTETHYLTDSQLLVPNYYALTGFVNSDAFEGYSPGEVLFYGVTGQEREDGLWEVLFKFGYQPNQTGLSVGTITGINKKGWEYLWVYFAKSVDTSAKLKIPVPTAVYVEQIYDYAPFSALGL